MPIKYDKNGNLKTINKKTTSAYCADYPKRFIEHSKQGKTTLEFCCEIGVIRETFDNWVEKYPELKEAKILGKQYAEQWWLDVGQRHLVVEEEGEKLETNLYKFIVAGRFGHRNKRKTKFEIDVTQLVSSLQNLASSCAKGDIDVDDFAKLSDGLVKAATLQQHEKMSRDIEELKRIAEKNQSERIGDAEEDI